MIQFKQGDLLQSCADIIAHQVNCQGVMGSGVAKQIRQQFPQAYVWYRRKVMKDFDHRKALLGTMQYVLVSYKPPCYVANLFAQFDYGSMKGRTEPYTDYQALRSSLMHLNQFANELRAVLGRKPSIAMPYLIGCARGGGDWELVKSIIQDTLSEQEVTFYQLIS